MNVPSPNTADLVSPKPKVIAVSFRFAISFLPGFVLGVVTSGQIVCSKCLGRTETPGCHWHPWP